MKSVQDHDTSANGTAKLLNTCKDYLKSAAQFGVGVTKIFQVFVCEFALMHASRELWILIKENVAHGHNGRDHVPARLELGECHRSGKYYDEAPS